MNAMEISDVIAEYLIENSDIAIELINEEDKSALTDTIYEELTAQ
jgi:hypothetical protein